MRSVKDIARKAVTAGIAAALTLGSLSPVALADTNRGGGLASLFGDIGRMFGQEVTTVTTPNTRPTSTRTAIRSTSYLGAGLRSDYYPIDYYGGTWDYGVPRWSRDYNGSWRTNYTTNMFDYWYRLGGHDRYQTAADIVEASFFGVTNGRLSTHRTAVLASGENFPDALAGIGLAGSMDDNAGAPILITNKDKLNADTKQLLSDMHVQTVYIVGGTGAISEEVEREVKNMNIAVTRVAGADRQATSVEALRLINGNWGRRYGTDTVIIATGKDFADALSISSFAYYAGAPIVLTKDDGTLTDDAVKAIKANSDLTTVIIVGGTKAVSDQVVSQIGGSYDYDYDYYRPYRSYSGYSAYDDYYYNSRRHGRDVIRLAGSDRYETSARIAEWEVFDPWGPLFAPNLAFVATGENFPDALVGGQLASGSPLLLVKQGNTSAASVLGRQVRSAGVDRRFTVQGNAIDDIRSGQVYYTATELDGTTLRDLWDDLTDDEIIDALDDLDDTQVLELARIIELSDFLEEIGIDPAELTDDYLIKYIRDVLADKDDSKKLIELLDALDDEEFVELFSLLAGGDENLAELLELVGPQTYYMTLDNMNANFAGIVLGGTAAVPDSVVRRLDDEVAYSVAFNAGKDWWRIGTGLEYELIDPYKTIIAGPFTR
jgi:putative cell wall-binding protein